MIQKASDQRQSVGAPTPGRPTIGEPFNPSRKACGFYLPDVLGRQRDLTDGQKRLYERAVRSAGQNGVFWRGFESMAEALGKSVRQVKADMAALEAKGLIRHTRRRRNSNVYQFLWHAMFQVQRAALQQDDLEVQDLPLEVQHDVVLEVQSTAQESSPLQSCPLDSVEADNKRISGYASQKSRSAASLPVMCSQDLESDSKAEAEPEAVANLNSLKDESPKDAWTSDDLATVRARIVLYWRREPEEGFEVSVMLRARGASAAAVCDLLDRKFANKNLRVGGKWAPKNQNWFLTMIENEFTPGHLPEVPSSARQDQREIESEILTRGIEAIELVDAPRSIVESVRCNDCGGAAMVQYTDGNIEGCGCSQKVAAGLKRLPASSAPGSRSPAGHERRSASS